MRRETISLRWLAGLAYPGGLLLLATWALEREEGVRNAVAPYALYFCFAALAGAALLSWYYSYARTLCVVIAVALAGAGLGGLIPGVFVPKLVVVFLLPLNVLLFAALRERGILTLGGFVKIAVLGAQGFALWMFGGGAGARLESLLNAGGPAGGWTWMPWSVLLSLWAAVAYLLVLVFLRRTKIEQALLWTLAAVFVGLNQAAGPGTLFVYFGAAGLILMLGVLEHGYDVAYLDELTGLPGRRAFNEALPLLRRRYSIAMCDVDHFKKFNDTYGHDAGDQVLKMVASQLSRVRGGGRVFRYGGEEFAILFRGLAADEVRPLVESLREAIANTEFVLRGPQRDLEKTGERPKPAPKHSVKITISIGYADRSGRRPTPERVLEAADAALYRAKESGRNCVKLAEAPAASETS